MAGGGNSQLRPQHGEFYNYVWYFVGAYVPPNDVPSVHCVDQALIVVPKGLEMTLMGDPNARLGDPCDDCEEEMVTALVGRGLFNMIDQFVPRRWYMVSGS